jgi:hypothetical protein
MGDGEMRNVYKLLVGKLEGKRPRGRPGHRWENDIRTILKEIGWEDVEGVQLAQDRDQWWALENMVMNLWVP